MSAKRVLMAGDILRLVLEISHFLRSELNPALSPGDKTPYRSLITGSKLRSFANLVFGNVRCQHECHAAEFLAVLVFSMEHPYRDSRFQDVIALNGLVASSLLRDGNGERSVYRRHLGPRWPNVRGIS